MTPQTPQASSQIVLTILNNKSVNLEIKGQQLNQVQLICALLDIAKSVMQQPPPAAPAIEVPPSGIAHHLLSPNSRPQPAPMG